MSSISPPPSPSGSESEESSNKKQVGIVDLEVLRADLVIKQHGAADAQLEFGRLSSQLNSGDTNASADAQGRIVDAVQRLAQANAELSEAQAKFLEAEMEAYRQTLEKAKGQKPNEGPSSDSPSTPELSGHDGGLKEQQQRIDQALQMKFSDLLDARRGHDKPAVAPTLSRGPSPG